MEIKRREFLKLFGGLSGSLFLGGCDLGEVLELPESLIEKARTGPGVETWQNTICGLCPGGCGTRVRLIDDIPVSIKGNPVYPVNRGGLCPLGLNVLHSLYHPDRLKGPVQRKGTPERPTWEPITWDNALQGVAERLAELRNTGKAHQVVFLGHEEKGLLNQHIARFMQAYGSPNYYRSSSAQNTVVPYSLVQGRPAIPGYDVLNARLIVSFGSNFLEEGFSPVYYTKVYSHHEEQQTRYIQIDSRLSLTASNADQWIPIRPGTYGALALGLAYVLIREEMYDDEFVQRRTFGFEDRVDGAGVRHVGFKNMVLGNYYPERVEELTGIPSLTILRLGRELGNTQPAFVLGDQGAVDNTNGTFAMMAIHSLNALLGNFEREGGIFLVDDPPFSALRPVQADMIAREGSRQPPIGMSAGDRYPFARFSVETFTNNILSEAPYPISVLFLRGGNPLFESLNRKEFAEALKKIPLVVSFDSILSETSETANLVLPEHHFMERWDEISNVDSLPFTHVGIRHPVVPPLHDTRHLGEVLIELARRIGDSVRNAFPFSTYEEELKFALEGVYKSGTGAIAAEGTSSQWIQYLRQRGWHIGQYTSFEEFWDRLVKQGGWWNPIRTQKRWDQIFTTPSKKFEFSSQVLKQTLGKLVSRGGPGGGIAQKNERLLNQLDIAARGDTVFLPHHEPIPSDPDMPLHLVTFRLLPVHDGQGAALPMMQELFGHSVNRYWQSWAELHPDTATPLHISDGDWIIITSAVGSLKIRAKVTQGIMPNVVAVPFGLGHTSLGRYAKGHGVNPNRIMRNLYDRLSGRPALQATKVRISLAT
ncbi:MAG: molybdopterin-dependent oxidoreductase [Ignavibacteriales bacterium]|nr:molybdopterin-dependent oxidoreductase [Ignavibacteriales bacterium]